MKSIQTLPFTLLEVLVATTIMGILISVLFSTFNAGARGYRQGYHKSILLQEARGVYAILSHDIQRVSPIKSEKNVFSKKRLVLPILNTQGLSHIEYLNQKDKLSRHDRAKRDNPKVTILRKIKTLEFAYLSEGEWREELADGAIPKAIRISFTLEDKGYEQVFNTSFQYPFAKTIKFPVAKEVKPSA